MKGLIFTYLVTYGGAAISLLNPYYGFLAYVCFAIIKPESLWHWSVPAGNYSRIIALGMLGGWMLNGFGQWQFGRSRAIIFSLIGFWGWAAVSTLTASNTDVALNFLETKGKIVLPVLAALTLIDSTAKLRQLAWTIVLSQGYVAFDLNMSYFDGFNRLHFDGFGGMDNNSQTIAMVAGVGVASFLGLQERSWWRQLLAFACAAFMTHAVFFSFSRGGMLSLGIVGIVSFLIIPKRPLYLVLIVLGALLAARMAGPEVLARFSMTFASEEERDESAQSRVVMWKSCIDLMLRNPVTGVGPDHYPLVVHTVTQYGRGKEAHTLWLQTGAELGIPGLMFLASFYFLTLWRVWLLVRQRAITAESDPFAFFVPRMVTASLAGFVVAAQFVSLEGLELPYYVALLGAGLLKLHSAPGYVPDLGHWPAPELEVHAYPGTYWASVS